MDEKRTKENVSERDGKVGEGRRKRGNNKRENWGERVSGGVENEGMSNGKERKQQ